MKQLVLYFLFFIVAAFFFIQCAKFFPSESNNKRPVPKGPATTSKTINKKSAVTVTKSTDAAAQKFTTLGWYFTRHELPLTMVSYFNQYPFFSYQYWGFYSSGINGRHLFNDAHFSLTNTDFWNMSKSGLVANNPDEEK